jgi:hypothetical protein
VAARTRSRPLYAVFLERVIQIEAVQCHREAVTDKDYTTRVFFSEGVLPGTLDHRWSVDEPKAFPWGPIPPATSEEPVSLPMQHAWNAAVAAWKGFIAALVNGELIANGVYQATGVRQDLDPAEWTRTCLMLDVRDADLIEGCWPSTWAVRWTAITIREAEPAEAAEPAPAAEPVRTAAPERKLGRIDWGDWWKHEVARGQQGLLPNKKNYLREAEPLIKERYGVTTVPASELRRIKAALYRGDFERPKRSKRKQPKL